MARTEDQELLSDGVKAIQVQGGGASGRAHAAGTAAAAHATSDPRPKKKKKKKSKKAFVALPAVDSLTAGGAVPWTIAFTQRLGRHVTATRDISAGDLVLQEKAVAAIPREHCIATTCHTCFALLPGRAAVGLSDPVPRYCSDACRSTHTGLASRTRPVLPLLRAIAKETDCDLDLLRIVLELEAVRDASASSGAPVADGNSANGHQEVGGSQQGVANGAAVSGKDIGSLPMVRCELPDVNALLTHLEKVAPAWRGCVAEACRRLHEALREAGIVTASTPEQLQHMAAAVNSNAHGVGAAAGSNTDQGFGMFPALSMLNHSCAPSCCFVSVGDVMEVRAVTDLKAGQELTVQYINLLEPRAVRAAQLLETKHFPCACSRCAAPLATSPDRFLEGVCCTAPGCSGVLVARPGGTSAGDGEGAATASTQLWECCGCGTNRPARTPRANGCADVVDAAAQDWQLCMALMQAGQYQESQQRAEAILATAGRPGQLHSLHVHVIDCHTPLHNCCRAQGDTKGALAAAASFVAAWDAVMGSTPLPELCNFLALLEELQLQRAESAPGPLRKRIRQQAAEARARLTQTRRICMGSDAKHPLAFQTSR